MAAQATSAEETNSYYPSTPWSGTSPEIATPATSNTNPPSPWSAPSATFLSESPDTRGSSHPATNAAATPVPAPSAQFDFWPFLLPQQTSLYQAQLLHYSNLVSPSRGGGLHQQSNPLASPPTVATSSHGQPASRSRASSKVANKDHPSHRTSEKGHGNKAYAHNKEKGDRAGITGREAPPSMPPHHKNNHHQHHHHNHHHSQRQQQGESSQSLPSRTRGGHKQAAQAHSSSVPSTPQQHARKFSYESREPSPTNNSGAGNNQNHSPRSAYSETNSALPSLRPLPSQGCPFETAQFKFRRRMPYNIGSGVLDKVEPGKVKHKLSEEHERKLTTDMRELYDRLLPTAKVEDNRRKLVAKLEKIFNEEWPGNEIRVHLFGSSGNLLCSDDSDVDICITTPWKEMEGVCIIADLLNRKGMEKVVCISAAKVPIVKIWDSELGLACDMNVNNTLALENTRMVRTYIEVDPRVRPLAMTIKYWTRKRILNDAAFGSTLSSYTWICLIIAFLQLRDPPILPALHQMQHSKLPKKDGTESSFADDINKLEGYGAKNKSTLGELLFQFFRFYAHEFDYGKHCLSVRQGKKLPKSEKNWIQDLCVEEPFNIGRNLGNTADEYSFRGLHMELRRAFNFVSEAKLDECCEQYEFPKEEAPPPFIRPPNAPRPVMIRSSSQQQSSRGGRNSNNRGGGRHSSNYRSGNSSRRASSSLAYDTNTMYMPPTTLTPQDLAWYAQQGQQQPQSSQQQIPYPTLLYTQSQVYQQMQAHMAAQYAQQQQQRMQGSTGPQQVQAQQQQQQQSQAPQGSNERSRTNSFDNPPLSAPLAPSDWYNMLGFPYAAFYGQGGYTYPSSPATTSTAGPEFRRSTQRSTMSSDAGTSTSNSSLRSQSQPASRSVPQGQQSQPYSGSAPSSNGIAGPRQVNGVPIPSFMPDTLDYDATSQRNTSDSPASDEGTGAYIGYYVSDAHSPQRQSQPSVANGISFGDLTQSSQGRRRLSTDQLPQTLLDRRMRRASRSPSPLGHSRAFSVGTSPSNQTSPAPPPAATGNGTRSAARPLVVNGTGSSAMRASSTSSQRQPPAFSLVSGSSSSENAGLSANDNPLNILGHGFNVQSNASEIEASQAPELSVQQQQPQPQQERGLPVIVNGSSSGLQQATLAPTSSVATAPQPVEDASFRDRIMSQHLAQQQNVFLPDSTNGNPWTANRQKALARQPHNGMIAPLDLAMGSNWANGNPMGIDAQHLSPINETRSPSPTTVRKPDQLFKTHKSMDPRSSSSTNAELEPSNSSKTSGDTLATSAKDARPSQAQSRQSTSATVRSTASGHPLQQSQTLAVPKLNSSHENGHVRGAKSESHAAEGGWQKATKGRKKGADNRTQNSEFVPSEQPPRHEADRKGG